MISQNSDKTIPAESQQLIFILTEIQFTFRLQRIQNSIVFHSSENMIKKWKSFAYYFFLSEPQLPQK